MLTFGSLLVAHIWQFTCIAWQQQLIIMQDMNTNNQP